MTTIQEVKNNITEEMRHGDKKDWYSFLKELRFFAKRNLMSFDVRNIGKQQLDKTDLAKKVDELDDNLLDFFKELNNGFVLGPKPKGIFKSKKKKNWELHRAVKNNLEKWAED